MVAASHGWSLEGIELFELTPADALRGDDQNTLFHPSEVELAETTKAVVDLCARVKPQRLVFDSLSEIRLLAQSPLRYRREVLSLKQHFAGRGCTVLLLDDLTGDGGGRPPAEPGAWGADARQAGPPLWRRSAGACASRSCAASTSAAAITTSSSSVAASWSFPVWSPPSTRTISSAASHRAGCPSWTRCWAAAWIAGPARCCSVRRERENRRWPRNGHRRPRRVAKKCSSTPSTRASRRWRRARSRWASICPPTRRRGASWSGRSIRRRFRPGSSPTRFVRPSRPTARAWSSSTASTATCKPCPTSRFWSCSCTSC